MLTILFGLSFHQVNFTGMQWHPWMTLLLIFFMIGWNEFDRNSVPQRVQISNAVPRNMPCPV